ncbi:2-amino-4-hydroxy-6-hydroxymethyldihydropteridine diphosphokinase [Streptococcus thoraltensis]|uniref:2-amino-4-hydroxy-6- hydroxymethyldihydropteridine diphosphokinase n=1 Tax=Streptococcus thoraltensis TaxID=55085 RepID=UPI00036D50E3|nr:2-amino-4-hydroxy-6-hydroxymethyldihydropteridine diphosphokinase [Streptococcus thoraltensis]MDY4761929.1 2-amino-4-hydroxy-6-hydroxymethyldihydropteridine diphosphokinase [Streptococcus thoraltensis]
MTVVFLSLGSNMGDKVAYLNQAIQSLSQVHETQLVKVSSFYRTAAWGKIDQDDFVNAVVQLETNLEAIDFLRECQQIEKDLDRVRHEHWGPRTIDIDILLYGEETFNTPDLKVPHPFMTERAFVLVPLAELTEDLVLPNTGKTVLEALAQLSHEDVTKI